MQGNYVPHGPNGAEATTSPRAIAVVNATLMQHQLSTLAVDVKKAPATLPILSPPKTKKSKESS
jgi:hypothetical protein